MQAFYQFTIKDIKYNSYKKLASLLFFISGLLFVFKGFRMYLVFDKLMLFGAAFILIVYSAYMWFYKKKKERSYFIIYILIIIVWIVETPYWYISLVYVVLMLLHYIMERDFIIRVADNNIEVHGFLKNNYSWNDFNNVVLKDWLLTLDFKNNKVLQVEIEGERSSGYHGGPIDDQAGQISFNEFCTLHLKQGH